MNNLSASINGHLHSNKWPYIHFTSDDYEVFKIGVFGRYQTMALYIYVPIYDETRYFMECSCLEFAYRPNAEKGNLKQSSSNIQKTNIEGVGIVFSNERVDIDKYDDMAFIQDFDSIVNACDEYNGEQILPTSLCDEWLSFIQDLSNITFSAANCNMPNAQETNSALITAIARDMGLENKLELFRSSEADFMKYPYYPTDLCNQQKYIKGLLRAVFTLEQIAYEESFTLTSNNIVFMAMRGMGISQHEREKMIVTEFESFKNHFPSKRYEDILQAYLYMSNDENRAMFLFEYEGISCE